MVKKLVIFGGLGIVLILIAASMIGSYNTMVTASQNVDSEWAQVQNVYQRRADLIPNLVATVKGYAAHEKDTLTAVIQARAAAVAQPLGNGVPNQQTLNQFDKNQSSLGSALSRLMVVVESYPNLKANQNFMALQYELTGTENRIAVERQRFNDAVKQYNILIKRFPGKLSASIFGFTPKAYFAASAQAQTAPEVKF
ncbi:MAG: LemA family protein [Gammaproteobacteria bacterium]|nr:LemA family protein [Gammaproteobacteria bacterium]